MSSVSAERRRETRSWPTFLIAHPVALQVAMVSPVIEFSHYQQTGESISPRIEARGTLAPTVHFFASTGPACRQI